MEKYPNGETQQEFGNTSTHRGVPSAKVDRFENAERYAFCHNNQCGDIPD